MSILILDTIITTAEATYVLHPDSLERHSIQRLFLCVYHYDSDYGFVDNLSQGDGAVTNMKSIEDLVLIIRKSATAVRNIERHEASTRLLFLEAPERPQDWVVPTIKCVIDPTGSIIYSALDGCLQSGWEQVPSDLLEASTPIMASSDEWSWLDF